MDFHASKCSEHDFTIFRKCLSVCMSPNFCGHCISRTNAWKFMKLYIQLPIDIIWYWLDFSEYRSRSSDVVRNVWFLHSGIGQNCVELYLIGMIISQSFWNSKHLFIIVVVGLYVTFVCMGAIHLHSWGITPQLRNFLPLLFSERTPQNTQN